MNKHIRTIFFFYSFPLFMCLISFLIRDATAQVDGSVSDNYTFETIEVPGVDFLALTASSDFEDYAGYTKSANGEKNVAFTLIDGVFTRYDFPGSQNTYFYALGNDGTAAGHYEDSDGLSHGIVLKNGELRQYDFTDSVQTEIYGISDATGALTGNFIDASGVRRGFTGEIVIEFPGAATTYADFVSAGNLVGSYIDAEGIYHAYVLTRERGFTSLGLPNAAELEYFFLHGINETGTYVARAKAIDDVPRTYVGTFAGRHELLFPDSVSTEGWNINQDGSIVGYYDTADGRRHGFAARPVPQADDEPTVVTELNYTFESIDVPGVEFLELTASSDFEDYAGNTRSTDGRKIVGFTLIDGVFTTYDFPGSQNTYFYALDNNGKVAGHYQDSNDEFHGVILENGELGQYDFPGSVQTEIYGISDTTGALTGNYIDASGVRRGFTGDTIIEFPGALATYADFVSPGGIIGSYVDTDGIFHPYVRTSDGEIVSLDLPDAAMLEYYFVPGINDAGIFVDRSKLVDDIPRTYVGTFLWRQNVQSAFALGSKCHLVKSLGALCGRHELRFPDSVITVGWNVNQDGSIVGSYDSADGRRHGFIARLTTMDTPAQIVPEPEMPSIKGYYAFQSINVPGVDYLEVAASNDFGDYAGNTRLPDSKKTIGFTLIDGVFATYDFPGSVNTYFYGLNNTGIAVGHYKDIDGGYHGVILEDGELRQYDFPGAAETHIYGISDETGALSGNIVDEAGVFHAFSGDLIITVPGAINTYGDFVNAAGAVVGSYIDADRMFHGFIRDPDGSFTNIDLPDMPNLDYLFVNTITDTGVIGFRAKAANDILRSYILLPNGTLHEVRLPGSVITAVRNVNQDGSIIGYYDTTDGRRHGFLGIPVDKTVSDLFGNYYNVTLTKGLNMLSLPLASPRPMTAKSFAGIAGATVVIALDAENQRFVGWTPSAPNEGFSIEGGQGYIVNVPEDRNFAFFGSRWTNHEVNTAAAPTISKTQSTWAFVVSGHLKGAENYSGYNITVRNTRTNTIMTANVSENYFAAATADLTRRSVVQVGDTLEVIVTDRTGNVASETYSFTVTPDNLVNALLAVQLDGIGQPNKDQLLQNYPNPFNPETWIPYQLSVAAPVSISIYNAKGGLVRTLSIGYQSEGFYHNQGRAAYWDGRNALGERVASGVYFFQLTTPSFQQTRRLVIVK